MTTMWIAITSFITVALLAMFIIVVTVFGLIAGHLIIALTISLVVLGGSALIAGVIAWAFHHADDGVARPREMDRG